LEGGGDGKHVFAAGLYVLHDQFDAESSASNWFSLKRTRKF